MKKQGILNKDISEVIAGLGHLDQITVCDAGLPIPSTSRRIDLAVIPGLPSFLDVLNALSSELVVQELVLANELSEGNAELTEKIKELFPGVKVSLVDHPDFKEMSIRSKAFIRTGEFTPYANVILISGVPF